MALTDRQAMALESSKHVTLRAGAGSGKTHVLTERYISLLESGLAGVSEIIAITFTEKAANQMKDKIRAKAARRIDDCMSAGDMDKAAFWERTLDELQEARISTIHSFCASLLRDNPEAAGVDPEFVVMDENVSALKIEESIEYALDWTAGNSEDDIYKLPDDWGRGKIADALRGLLSKGAGIRRWAEEFSSMSVQEILARHRAAAESFAREVVSLRWIDEKLGLLSGLSCDDPADKQWGNAETAARWLAEMKAAWEGSLLGVNCADVAAMNFVGGGGKKSGWREGDIEAWKEIRDELRAKAKEMDKFRFSSVDEKYAESCGALARMTLAALGEYRRRCGDGAFIGFDELQERALECLEKSPETARKSGHKFVMVDEFQDTNPAQWRLVKALAGDGRGGFKENVFIVGDEKQSIYGFRGADVRVFSEASKELAGGGASGVDVALDVNFRSHPRLVEFFNLLFAHVFDGGIAYEESRAGRTDSDSDRRVEIIAISKEEAEDFGGEREMEAELVARRLADMLRGPVKTRVPDEAGGMRDLREEDIAVLFRKTTHLKKYEDAFRRHGLRFLNLGGYGFFDAVEIVDIMNALKFLADPRDEISLAGALRSPLFGLSDETLLKISLEKGGGFFEKLVNYSMSVAADARAAFARDRLSAWMKGAGRLKAQELISRILDETGARGIYGSGERGEQALLNIEKLMDMGAGFEESGGGLGPFMKWRRMREKSGASESEAQSPGDDGCGVRFLTVHKAKGLEFPVVVVQNASFDYAKSGGFNFVTVSETIDGKMEAAFKVMDEGGGKPARKSPVIAAVIRGMELKAVEKEEKRLLYVACTRAKERLIIAGCEAGLKDGSVEMGESPRTWTQEIHAALRRGDIRGRFDEMVEWRETSTVEETAADAEKLSADINVIRERFINPGAPDDRQSRIAKYLAEPPPAKSGATISVTELSAFAGADGDEKKMRQYQNAYIYGIPASWNPRGKSGAAHKHHPAISPLARGEAVHRLFEELHSIRESRIEKRLEEILLELNASPGAEMDALVRKYATSAKKFLRSEAGRAAGSGGASKEMPFTLMAGPHAIIGKIDLLIDDGSGALRVVDYKTNIIRRGQENEALEEYRTQLETYAAAALMARSARTVSASLFFTETGAFSDSIEVAEDGAAALLAKLESVVDLIDAIKNTEL